MSVTFHGYYYNKYTCSVLMVSQIIAKISKEYEVEAFYLLSF